MDFLVQKTKKTKAFQKLFRRDFSATQSNSNHGVEEGERKRECVCVCAILNKCESNQENKQNHLGITTADCTIVAVLQYQWFREGMFGS